MVKLANNVYKLKEIQSENKRGDGKEKNSRIKIVHQTTIVIKRLLATL